MKPCQELGKISIILVLITSLVFGVWVFAGWPRIWQKLPVPPEVQGAQGATTQGMAFYGQGALPWWGLATTSSSSHLL